MAQEDLDLVLHLGDYVYEGGIAADGGYRQTPTPEVLREAPRDVERWRMQYALYKSDPDLQAAHARFPWMVTWDDHEVQNVWAGSTTTAPPATGSGTTPGTASLRPATGSPTRGCGTGSATR
jgi:phosphodiesterase/alkaline phosphatase D-like protein